MTWTLLLQLVILITTAAVAVGIAGATLAAVLVVILNIWERRRNGIS